ITIMTNPNAGNERSKKGMSPGLKKTLRITLKISRYLLVPALCLAALFIGLTIGYATIGGGSAGDVFRFETWKHLYDLVFEGT
ncbi:MAG TPA: DNA-directed RNA polymerase subunit beta, partial [Anaerovoracaceae bacterium]|nr:DNA-directed RNA polymerase subunit beta [Anaerovoracaceae bacterium]